MFRDLGIGGHYLSRHVATWLWVALPSWFRWSVADRMNKSAGFHWCDLVTSCCYADQWIDTYSRDYTGPLGCPCDFPLPYLVSRSNPDCCYCGTCSCDQGTSAPDA